MYKFSVQITAFYHAF